MKQSSYAQVIMFRRKDLKFDAADKNKTNQNLNFKVNPEDHDYGLILIQIGSTKCFSTREPDFYKKLFQSHDNEQDTNTFKTHEVPIGNAKVVKSFVFHKDAPILSYCQKH